MTPEDEQRVKPGTSAQFGIVSSGLLNSVGEDRVREIIAEVLAERDHKDGLAMGQILAEWIQRREP